MSEATPASAGAAEDVLFILRSLADLNGESFDVTRATQALRQAERDIPPTATRAARLRLTHAAEAIGLQLLVRRLSAHEAVTAVGQGMTLVAFAVTSAGTARWHLVTAGRGNRVRLLHRGEEGSALTAAELAQALGATDADAVLEWLYAVPAPPPPLTETTHTDEHAHDAHGPAPLRRLFALLQVEKRDLWIVVLYAIAVGVLSLAVPLTAMAVVNTVALATLLQQLLVLSLVLLAAMLLAALFRGLQIVVVEYIQQRLFTRVVADLAYRLPRVELKAFDRQHGPELVNRFFDVLTVQKSAATLLLDGVDVFLQGLIGLILLAAYHQVLLGFDLFLLAGLAFILFVLGRHATRTSIQESRTKYAVAGWMEELARNPAAFKLGGSERFALERADALTRDYLLARQQHFRILLRQHSFALFLQALAVTTLLSLGGYLVIIEQLTLGQLVAAQLVVSLVVASFTKLGKQLESYYDLLAAVEKLGHLMELPLERQGGIVHQARSHGAAVHVHDVHFSFEHGHRVVLQGFTLNVEAGERIALLGPNGSGKTTLVELLFGMRSPTQGRIEIDGVDVRELRLDTLRDHVAIVRGIEIFEGTVFENVRMGRDELTHADVRAALHAVGLLDDVQNFPDGLRTPLTVGGRPLSLGQAERLMLARAIAGQPRLLVLDETLDDMDQAVRHDVLPAVLGREARWTLLVITHSNEVASLCDRHIRMGLNEMEQVSRSES